MNPSSARVRSRLAARWATPVVVLAIVLSGAPVAAEDVPRGPGTGRPAPDEVIEQQTTPLAQIQASDTTVAIVSDSIGWDFSGHLFNTVSPEFPVVFNKSILGGEIVDFHQMLVELVRSSRSPDVLVLVLGTAETEDGPSTASVRQQMRALIDDVLPFVGCVRWLDTQTADAHPIYRHFNAHRDRMNRIIHAVMNGYDDRVEYVHYGSWSELAPRRYFRTDDLHLSGAGRVGLGRLINQAAAGCDEPTNVGGFWDVKDGFWAADAVDWMNAEGLATGYDNRSYRARIGSFEVDVTRGQVAGMLWRLAGSPAAGAHGWTDGGPWIDPALNWLAETGLAEGYRDGTFRAGSSISRGEVLRMVWRLAGGIGVREPHSWSDGAPWIDTALDWVQRAGLMVGHPDGTFRPTADITRAEIASLLQRYAPILAELPVAAPTDAGATVPTTLPAPSSSTVVSPPTPTPTPGMPPTTVASPDQNGSTTLAP